MIFFVSSDGAPRYLPGLTRSCLTRRSSDLDVVRIVSECKTEGTFADIDATGRAHHAFQHFDATFATGALQFAIAGQLAHFAELAAIAKAKRRRQQSAGDATRRIRKQACASIIEVSQLGDRHGLIAIAADDRLDVEHRAEGGAHTTDAAIALRSEEHTSELQSLM